MNLLINSSNDLLVLETLSEQNMNIRKIFHLGMNEPISDVLFINTNLIIATEFGRVFTYKMNSNEDGLKLTQTDRLDLFSDPHGSSLDDE